MVLHCALSLEILLWVILMARMKGNSSALRYLPLQQFARS